LKICHLAILGWGCFRQALFRPWFSKVCMCYFKIWKCTLSQMNQITSWLAIPIHHPKMMAVILAQELFFIVSHTSNPWVTPEAEPWSKLEPILRLWNLQLQRQCCGRLERFLKVGSKYFCF
jgi:hypothetical protein